MRIYGYRCSECGTELDDTERADRIQRHCAQCGTETTHKRVFSVSVWRPMMQHMNATTGKPVSSMRQFNDQLKAMSDEATLRTGIDHKYEPVDPELPKRVVEQSQGVGLESTNRARHASGRGEVKL